MIADSLAGSTVYPSFVDLGEGRGERGEGRGERGEGRGERGEGRGERGEGRGERGEGRGERGEYMLLLARSFTRETGYFW